ncbi:Abi family protein [Vibrio parahaemolyticus]|uniref:Abi family protein n=1 Tax=Vibrio parahaemolyticus TaxID=670 RepID=UPI0023606F4D|nr:Abi family protein [Vibrio parahaemolyticus]HDY7465241.1 Abi family protein [Vibrio vulnificus]
MQPENLNKHFDALSAPRIGAYRNYFGQQLTDEQVFGCYQWNESVSHCFFKVITLVEIVMRNKMHHSLSGHYHSTAKHIVADVSRRSWQYQPYSTIGSVNSCNWYHAIDPVAGQGILVSKSLSKIHSRTHRRRQGNLTVPLNRQRRPSPDDVVSSLSFGFWSSLVSKCPTVDWATVLVSAFPQHRASKSSQWHSDIERAKLSNRLDFVRDFRNRIAHHEPIWKFKELYSESPKVHNGRVDRSIPRDILSGPTTNSTDSIRRLRNVYKRCTELLKWVSKDIYDDLMKSSVHKHMLWLCSDAGLEAHINRGELMPTSMKASRFKRELTSILKSRKMIYLYHGGRNVMMTHPIY